MTTIDDTFFICLCCEGSTVDATVLPSPSELHVHTTSRIFECFRNVDVNYFTSNIVVYTDMMQDAVTQELFGSRPGLHSGSTPHGDISHTFVCQSAFPTLNHAYLYLDSNGCVIRPEVISFSNRTEETRRQHHLPAEYLSDHAQIAQHEMLARIHTLYQLPDLKKLRSVGT
uniref:Uncharacterized protein n=1 Tax=Tanacetum cinerariifolium TaxID=118510 RepID=A0A6L2LU90_TANCI|nr:hypothetical protein [Tanacetum cinerariifolium]